MPYGSWLMAHFNAHAVALARLRCNAVGLPYDAVILPSISAYWPCVRFDWRVIDLFD